ncbi:MAG: helix-turn-helix domain-containing protein [Oscillospiraceae bacterium]|nr:helix-turn-helix domain-containing protein [Oscillospiraceae bacterium]
MAKILFAIELDDNENMEEVLKNISGITISDCKAESGNKFNDNEVMLTGQDIIDYLGVGKTTVYGLFNRNDFPSVKINNRHMIRKDLFLKFIDSHYGKSKKRSIK